MTKEFSKLGLEAGTVKANVRRFATSSLAVAFLLGSAQPAYAGSPHFVQNAFVVTIDGGSVTVSGKEAGLGDELQVHVVLTVDAECINPGDHHPRAENKASATAEGDFPVQNGKADFTLTATPTFQPDCSPPMEVVITSIRVCDTTNRICTTL